MPLHRFENSRKSNRATRRHIPEDFSPHLHAILCLTVTKRPIVILFRNVGALISRTNKWMQFHKTPAELILWLLSVSVPNCIADKIWIRNAVRMKKLKFTFVSLWRIGRWQNYTAWHSVTWLSHEKQKQLQFLSLKSPRKAAASRCIDCHRTDYRCVISLSWTELNLWKTFDIWYH